MAESQSRFSIIEELTKQKSNSSDKVNDLLSMSENDGLDLKKWEKAVADTREDKTTLNAKNKLQREREIDTLKDRIKELDKAITAIQSISANEKK